MKKPTAREYQWEKPMCLIEHDDCADCFESADDNYKGSGRCDKCKIAIEHKNKEKKT